MKHVIFLGDGMADYPVEALDGRTPLEAAVHPAMDELARRGRLGLTVTIPEGMPTGSDVANLSVMGIDPTVCYSGRSPLEAVSMGIELADTDVTYRCNLVTLAGDGALEEAVMLDHSAGEIESHEAAALISVMRNRFGGDALALHAGVSYRHCLVLHDAEDGAVTEPPHDILTRPVKPFLPSGANAPLLREMMEYAWAVLRDHPVNRARAAQGRNPANAVWFWGEGRRPSLPSFAQKYGVTGSIISAVDLLHGIGLCMGLRSVEVPGATGNAQTDFAAKGRRAVEALQSGSDFIYIHVEAPDECGHQGQLQEKIWCIEQLDKKIVAPVMEYLQGCGEDYSVLLMPDHPTPLALRTHTRDAVPFALFDSRDAQSGGGLRFTEADAGKTSIIAPAAYRLMDALMRGKDFFPFISK